MHALLYCSNVQTTERHEMKTFFEIEYADRYHTHCKVIICRNPIEANANTGAIQLLGNPIAYIRNGFILY